MASPELNFIKEAELILQEVNYAIKDGRLSSMLPCNERTVYLNITTKEDKQFCVRLNMDGFQVVGNSYDNIAKKEEQEEHHPVFETVFALLDYISQSYRQQFSSQLTDKLLELQSIEKDNK